MADDSHQQQVEQVKAGESERSRKNGQKGSSCLELRDRYRRTESSSLLEEFMLDTRRHKSVPVEEMLALALKFRAVSLIATDSGLNSVQIDTSWWFQ